MALIRYPRFRELHDDVVRCQNLSKLSGEPQCMSLEGPTGAGKTTLMRVYASMFRPIDGDAGARIPVLYMETPSPISTKGMAAAMLEALGDPAAHKGTQWSLNSRLITLLRACQVELVILDDFQHLIDSDTDRVLQTVSEWLKVTIKNSGIPFVVVGITGRVERVLQENSQLSRLFASREELSPLYWHREDDIRSRDFREFVEDGERAIGLPLAVPFDRTELLDRIYWATGGIVANIMNLLLHAQDKALGRVNRTGAGGTPQVELADLSWAYAKRMAKHMRRFNPFASAEGCWSDSVGGSVLVGKGVRRSPVERGTCLLPEEGGRTDAPNSTNNRARKPKKAAPTPADVLRAS
jgi:energy-coupling factor transporter ATP-binding protein EcfA2